ncbi:uncharacterized protein [Miscanthus floridulus]|uniref:uncharacterized protein n=1 Tax=Miscanthus floridulus TaxID=154761 RepID=UPI003459AEB6
MDKIAMEESISSSRTTAFYGNSYYSHHHQEQQQSPALAPASVAAAATSDFEDADSGWTAYFLQLASDEEEDASASNREKQQLRDVGGVLCGRGSASTSTVSKPNKAKDNKEAVKKGVKKTKDEVLHLVGTTGILEEEDPLQDTASSPLVQLNINGDLQEVWSTPAGGRDRPPVQRRRSGGDINGRKD